MHIKTNKHSKPTSASLKTQVITANNINIKGSIKLKNNHITNTTILQLLLIHHEMTHLIKSNHIIISANGLIDKFLKTEIEQLDIKIAVRCDAGNHQNY